MTLNSWLDAELWWAVPRKKSLFTVMYFSLQNHFMVVNHPHFQISFYYLICRLFFSPSFAMLKLLHSLTCHTQVLIVVFINVCACKCITVQKMHLTLWLNSVVCLTAQWRKANYCDWSPDMKLFANPKAAGFSFSFEFAMWNRRSCISRPLQQELNCVSSDRRLNVHWEPDWGTPRRWR